MSYMQENLTSVPAASTVRRFSFDTAALWALVLTGAITTLIFTWGTAPFLYTKVSALALGAVVTLALYILARLTRGNVIFPPLALVGALWLVPLAYALSALFSGVGIRVAFFGDDLAPDTFGFVLLLAVLATLTALTLRRAGHYRTFFRVGAIALVLALVAQVVFIAISRFAPTVIAPTANVIGAFSDLGMLIGLGITLLLLALRFLTFTRRTRILLLVGGAIGLALLALVNSVLIWGVLALVSLGLFIEAILRHRASSDEADLDGVALLLSDTDGETVSTQSHSLVAPLITLVIALFFIIGGSTIGNSLVSAFGANVLDVRPSWQSTFDVGSHTYASSPLFGSGPGTFGVQWLKFRDRSLNDTIFWNVDFTSGVGYIPTSFVTTGIMGALAWLAFLALFLFFGLRALLFRMPGDTFVRFVSIASFTGALYVLALSIFAVPGPVVLLAGFLLVGVFVSSLRYAGRAREWGIIFAKSPRIGFVIVFGLTLLLLASVLTAYVVVERYLGSLAYGEASAALNSGALDAADAAIGRSILFAPSDKAYQLAAAIGIAHMSQIASDATLSASDAQQKFQAALSASIEAALTGYSPGPQQLPELDHARQRLPHRRAAQHRGLVR